MKLNIGCGKDIKKGFVNIDLHQKEGVDLVWNLDVFPYPFKDNSISEIYAKAIIEHLDDVDAVMRELYRILEDKGKLRIIVPHFTSTNAFKDYTHKHFFAFNSFNKWDSALLFNVVKKKIVFGKKYNQLNRIIEILANKSPIIYENTFLRTTPAMSLDIEMIKENRENFVYEDSYTSKL